MRLIKISLHAFFCIVIFYTTHAQSISTIRIDPDNSSGGTISQLTDSVSYIPLETTKESLFGRIDKLILTNKYFFILDHSTDVILLFTRNGKFYSKISLDKWIKTPNRESLGIRDFTVNEKSGIIVVSHEEKQKNLYFFDFHGKLLKVNNDNVWVTFGCIDEDHYLMESYEDIADTSQKLAGNCIITGKGITALQKFLLRHIDTKFDLRGGRSITQVQNSNTLFYTRSYDYNAYLINSNGITDIYRFVFPLQYTLPKDFLSASFFGKQQLYLSKYPVIFTLSDVYKIKNYLLFSVYNQSHLNLIYNINTGNLFTPENITADSTNGYLPISSGDPTNILAADTSSFYTSIPAYELIRAYEETKDKKPVYSLVMKAFFKTKNRQSNPIIVQLRLKDNL